MIYPAHRGDVRISHVHNAALRQEISERLVVSLGQRPVGMPPQLMVLIRQLRDEPPKQSISIREAIPARRPAQQK